MSLKDQNDILLSDLPLFRGIKEDLTIRQQHSHKISKQNGLPHNSRNQPQTTRISRQVNNLWVSGMQYVPPLSAYNASVEAPFFPSTRNGSAGRFDELTMRYEQTQQKFRSIRMLGWNFLKPIGMDGKVKSLKERRMNEIQRVSDEPVSIPDEERMQSFVLPGNFQENGSESNILAPVSEDGRDLGPDEMEGEDDGDDDDDASYDYDAEFARVEDEHDDEEEHEQRLTSNRGVIRDVTIQQFVETSHIDRNPYEINDEYERSHLNVDVDNGDSGDFTEIPWVEVSDTVQSVDSPRVTSLNSVIERRTVPTRNLRRNRRIPDNNSDQSSDLLPP